LYNSKQISAVFGKGWDVISCEHILVEQNIINPKTIHAEWRISATKVGRCVFEFTVNHRVHNITGQLDRFPVQRVKIDEEASGVVPNYPFRKRCS
jgi:hypothetical protein